MKRPTTIAIRMPDNRIALSLIRSAGIPIAASSANRFGYPSPTQAIHVAADLVGQIDLILDGGSTELGVESTRVDIILVEGFTGGHIEDVVLDRLRKAAGSNIIHVGRE